MYSSIRTSGSMYFHLVIIFSSLALLPLTMARAIGSDDTKRQLLHPTSPVPVPSSLAHKSAIQTSQNNLFAKVISKILSSNTNNDQQLDESQNLM